MKKNISPFLLFSCMLLCSCKGKEPQSPQKASPSKEKKAMNKTTLPSGLEIIVVKEASGAKPNPGDYVTVHYTGWLDNGKGEPGKKFDSSVDRGEPFGFTVGVGQVIRGWDEGILKINKGGKVRLKIPAALGYGPHGAGSIIPPHAPLIFDVELISIN